MTRMTNFRSAAIATGNAIDESAYDNVKKVADNISNVNNVNNNEANINAVVANEANINTTASDINNIKKVADNIVSVDVVSTNVTSINTVATNLNKGTASEILSAETNANIALNALNDFKGRYLGGQVSDPTLDLIGNPLNEGDIYFNTTAKEMRVYSGTAWKTAVDSYTKTELDGGQLDNRYYTHTALNSGQLDTRYYTKTEINTANVFRADKYLASQNLSNMEYNTTGDLIKIQYNNATDVDYELFTYTSGNLTDIAHYVGGTLKGNSVLSYTNGDLTSVIFTGV